jgi:hypothetical protein
MKIFARNVNDDQFLSGKSIGSLGGHLYGVFLPEITNIETESLTFQNLKSWLRMAPHSQEATISIIDNNLFYELENMSYEDRSKYMKWESTFTVIDFKIENNNCFLIYNKNEFIDSKNEKPLKLFDLIKKLEEIENV